MVNSEAQSADKMNIFGKIVYSNFVQGFVIVCIALNSIQLGLDTSAWWHSVTGNLNRILDSVFIWIFVVEIVLKLLADKHRFFTKGWNIFDFLVVAVAFVPGNGAFSVLRVFRCFRALRLLYRIPRLRIIVESLFSSIPSIGWISLLLAIWFYICSVIATNLFGGKFPDWFGSIGKSMYSLFQIMTLESWSMGIVRPVMTEYPYAWLLFVPFIIFATYTVMNLFIGVMVSAISDAQNSSDHREEEKNVSSEDAILTELRNIRKELEFLKNDNAELKKRLDEK
jgi:voltage-gated sodium channel